MEQSDFGSTIRKRRMELGLTQKAVAQKLGVAQAFVNYLESNRRNPTNGMIKKLAQILFLPTDKLYLSAHPDLKDFLDYDQNEKTLKKRLPPVLLGLKNDAALCSQHKITAEELEQLASLRLRGEVKSKEDYVFLLMSLRQVLK